MQKVIPFHRISDVASHMDADVFRYIGESQIESFESFDTFILLAFDWYDIHSVRTGVSKSLIYMDQEDIFFLCQDTAAELHFSKS